MLCILAMCSTFYVIDGDTLGRTGIPNIRIWGIDAPEMSEEGGAEAKVALQDLVAGREIRCVEVDRDRYGRVVARCSASSRDIACDLVSQGHARDWPKYSGGHYTLC